MKKILLVVAIFIAGVSFNDAKAQDGMMSIDAQFGVPVGDASDSTDLQFGVNFTYYFVEVMEALKIGGRAGYGMFVVNDELSDFGFDNFDFITLGAAARYDFSESLFARLDLGYAIGLADESDGAMFVEPRFGYNLGNFDIFAYYQSIFESGTSLDAVGVGFALKF